MVSTTGNLEGTSNSMDWVSFGRKKASSGQAVWVSMEPSPKEVVELSQYYSDVVELPEGEVRVEIEEWLAKGLVVRSLGWRVSMEGVVHEFGNEPN